MSGKMLIFVVEIIVKLNKRNTMTKQPLRKELVILEKLNTKGWDFKIIDKQTKKELGGILETPDGLGYELYPNFKVPDGYEFPKTARNSMEAMAIFNKYYELIINS
jgi:hypothetical protein